MNVLKLQEEDLNIYSKSKYQIGHPNFSSVYSYSQVFQVCSANDPQISSYNSLRAIQRLSEKKMCGAIEAKIRNITLSAKIFDRVTQPNFSFFG